MPQEFRLSLKDFRGFHHQGYLRIAPITILIGENSAGKTSFLAALKYMLDFASGEEEPSFNKDPFQLGTFEQIAHHRGGRAGRAKNFQISLSCEVLRRRRNGERRTDSRTRTLDYMLQFSGIESQAQISSISVKADGDRLDTKFESGNLSLEYTNASGERFHLEELRRLPRVARSDISRYWPFLLRELHYRMNRPSNEDQQDLLGDGLTEAAGILAHNAGMLSSQFSGRVIATSAIRTKPLRTYTPGIELEDGEGSHVPFELAKLARQKNRESWRRIKKTIDEFGQASEMFKEIHVKTFGQSASDPFQIQFSNDGRKTNIVDLGYGTSQILPIIYMLATENNRSRHLIQQPEVHLHPKAQAALGEFFISVNQEFNTELVIETHSDFIVDRLRRAIGDGRLTRHDVSILFFERSRLENRITQIEVDDMGEPVDPPLSYRSFFLGEQMYLLGVE